MEMSKDANAIDAIPKNVGQMKSSGKVVGDVEKIIRTESQLISGMKEKNSNGNNDRLAEQLQQQNEQLESDASQMAHEANAGNFANLDVQLDGKRLAKSLQASADRMDREALDVEHGDVRRELRGGAAKLHAKTLDISAKAELKALKKQEEEIRNREAVVGQDPAKLDNAVAEENWESEEQIGEKTLADIANLESGANDLEKELKEYWEQMGEDDRKQYQHSINEMRSQANSLKKMVEAVEADVKHKAKEEVQKLRFKAEGLKPLLKLKRFEPAPKKPSSN